MSAYVKKIQFKLHESYGNPLRGKRSFTSCYLFVFFFQCIQSWSCSLFILHFLVVTKPPYEITETGWGEFEIIIKIFFIDPNERPVRV